jgi:glutathione S-transferase
MITVFGAPPSRAVRVIWMLEEMDLPYEVRPLSFSGLRADAGLQAASPAGMLPAIRDGEVALAESVAILEYLAARHGPTPLAPTVGDPHYPQYLQYLHFGEASLAAPLNICIATRHFAPEEHKANWGAQASLRIVVRRCKALTAQLQRTPYLAGEPFTAADISCAYGLHLLRALGEADGLGPVLEDYWDRITARPAYIAAQRHTAPLF